eukprot:6209238-Pleurochrysis_carterae.AAC.1
MCRYFVGAVAVMNGFHRAQNALNIKILMQRSHWVLLGARRVSLSSKIGRALRTALDFELSSRQAIALGAHEVDFNAAPEAF